METSANYNQEVLHIVNQLIKQRGIRTISLGERMGLTYSGTHKMLTDNKLTVSRLKELSLILDYNFFAKLAEDFDLSEPKLSDIKGQREKELEQRIHDLEIESQTLLKILRKGD